MGFVKDLSHSEAKYKYVGLSKAFRETLPEKDVFFDVKFKDKIYKMKVNNKDCIMLSQLYDRYQFKEGNIIKFDTSKKVFELSVE